MVTNRVMRASAAFVFLATQTFPLILCANPAGEQIVAGSAEIERAGSTLTVNQATDKIVINWQEFSIGSGELTKFVQPSATSAVLNRVVGDNLSGIYGTLQSNGQVYLINPNGIVVGAQGVINTGGFAASTHDIADQDFLAGGNLTFSGNSDAAVTNLGAISATGGDVFLIASKVENRGSLTAAGTVGLAAGQTILLSDGPEKLFVQPSTVSAGSQAEPGQSVLNAGLIQAAAAELKAAGGNIYALAIKNEGTIRATGSETVNGRVLLKAQGNISNTGTIQARNADGSGGRIELSGGVSMAEPSTVTVGGVLDVSAIEASEAALIEKLKGGEVAVTGQQIKVEADALITANGASGGGTILIGGDYQGGNTLVQNAEKTYISSGAKIEANALHSGDGGRVIVWADEWTQYLGSIEAKGGQTGGGGGFAEVSGKQALIFEGSVDLSAENGDEGTLLLDPTDITIQNTGPTTIPNNSGNPDIFQAAIPLGSGVITVTSLLNALANADVEIRTQNALGAGSGDITVADDVIYNGLDNRTLTLVAERHIILNNGVEIIGSSAQLNVNLLADTNLNGVGDITLGSGTFIQANGGGVVFSASGFVLDTTANITGNTVRFEVANAGLAHISLGGTGGGLVLSDAELDTVQANILQIYNTTGGNIVLEGNVTLAFPDVGKLYLNISGGNLDDQVANSLAVRDLELSMGSGQVLMGGAGHDVDFLSVSGSSQFDFKDADDLFLNGLVANGNIRLIAGTDIGQTSLIYTNGSLTLDAGGEITLTVNINEFSSLEVLTAQSVRISNSRTAGVTLGDVSVTDFFDYEGNGPILVDGTIQSLGGDIEVFTKGSGNDLTLSSTTVITTGNASINGGSIMLEAEGGEVFVTSGAIFNTQGNSATGGVSVEFGSVTMNGGILLGKGDVVLVGGETVNYWTDGGVTGDWNDAANWSLGAVPAGSQDVIIGDDVSDTLITVTAGSFARKIYSDVNVEVSGGGGLNLAGFARFEGNVNLADGDLVLAGNSSVAGLLTLGTGSSSGNVSVALSLDAFDILWNGGTLSGAGTVRVYHNMDLDTVFVPKVLSTSFNLKNGATANVLNGDIEMAGGTLNIESGAAFNWLADTTLVNAGGTNQVNNNGEFNSFSGTGDTIIESGISFLNNGFLSVSDSILRFEGALSNSGDIEVNTGAGLALDGSQNYDFFSGATLSGAGTLYVSNGNLNINSDLNDFQIGVFNQSGGVVSGSGSLETTLDFIQSGGSFGVLDSLFLTKASGDFLLNSLSATNDLFITATTGAIIDNNGVSVNLSALDITLSAATGIGATDAIETAAGSLTAGNSGTGDIRIINNYASGTTVSTLVNSAAGGGINFVQGAGSLTLLTSAVTGNTADISLSAGSLNVSGALIATGSADGGGTFNNSGATITGATILAGTGTTITLNGVLESDVVISSSIIQATTINLSSQGDIVVDNLLQTSGTGASIVLVADSNNNGTGGVYITTAGQLDSFDSVSITGSSFTNLGGSGTYAAGLGYAIYIEFDGINNQIQAANGISLNSNTLYNNDIHIGGVLSNFSGDIVLDAAGGRVDLASTLFNNNGDVRILSNARVADGSGYYIQNSGSGAIEFMGDLDMNNNPYYLFGDDINFLGGVASVNGPGILGIAQQTTGLQITIGGSSGAGLLLDNTDLAALALDGVSIGNSLAGLVTMATAFLNPSFVAAQGSDIDVTGTVTANGQLNLTARDGITIQNGAAIIANNADVNLSADQNEDFTGGIESFGSGYISAFGNLDFSAGEDVILTFVSASLSGGASGTVNLDYFGTTGLNIGSLGSGDSLILDSTSNTAGIFINDMISVTNDVTIISAFSLNVAASGSIVTGTGTLGTFNNNGASIDGGATITAGDMTTITLNAAAAQDVIIGSALIQASVVNINALRDIVINELVQTTGGFNINITADTDNNGSGGVLITALGQVDSSGDVAITGSSFTNLGGTGSYGAATGYAVYVENDGVNNQIQAQGNIVIQGNSSAPGADIKLVGNTESFAGGLLVSSQNVLELAGFHVAGGGSMEFTGATTLVGATDLDVDDENLVFYNTVDGAFQLNLSAGSGDVIFWENGGSSVALAGLEILDSGSVYFDNGFHATNLFVNSSGSISAFDTLTAVAADFSSTGGAIDLDTGAHQIGSLSFSAPGQTVDYVGTGTYTVTSAQAGTFNLTSNTGDIIDGGNWNVSTLSLTAANGTAFLTIDDDGASPTLANYATQGLDITTAFSYNFGNLIYGGNLTLHAGGAVTQSGALNISGDLVLDTPGQTVDLSPFGNSVGSFRADATSVSLQTSGPLSLSGGNYDTLTLVVNGNVTQSAAITVNNVLSINSQGSISLANAGNKITSLANASALTTINIFEDPGFTITGPVTAGGDIVLGTNGGDLILNGSVLSLGGGFVSVYTDQGFNVINNVGAGVFGSGNYAVYTTVDTFLGGLLFDQTLSALAYPAAVSPSQNTLVLFTPAPANPPSLADVDNNPPINQPSNGGGIVTGEDEQGAGGLQGGGIIQTAYSEQEGGDFLDNEGGVIGLDSFGNSQQITDVRIIILLKEALDDKAQQDLLAAIGITLEEFNDAAGGNLVTPGEVFDLSDLSSGSLAAAPKALQDALSDKAKAELEAILEQIMGVQGDLDGVTVTIGQAFDIATGQRLPDVPMVLVISMSSIARLELERAMAP